MKIAGKHYRSVWVEADGWSIGIIDQTKLPHEFVLLRLTTGEDCARAIKIMQTRGAPLIGAVAAYGLALALRADASDENLDRTHAMLLATRPTAINLRWALDAVRDAVRNRPRGERVAAAYAKAKDICDDDVATCEAIGRNGLTLFEQAWEKKGRRGRLDVLTHCNAGWLATVDWGTALAPIYMAHDKGLPIHVWVDETRPRNQGAALTAWELGQHGVAHTVIVDNAGGHLMQHGKVDLCVVGTDRVTANGDVCNKIGTYLKALAAKDNGVPFYVGLPHSTIDWTLDDGMKIPIEEREAAEVTEIAGRLADGTATRVTVTPAASAAANYGFDVTPARLVTALVTERGVCPATREGLKHLYGTARRAI
ncbi:MAG: S-methyl-5-thioribose-1-phosphate isomerase [Alphaproteobacteria bacterium]